jgi:hypothetical protein
MRAFNINPKEHSNNYFLGGFELNSEVSFEMIPKLDTPLEISAQKKKSMFSEKPRTPTTPNNYRMSQFHFPTEVPMMRKTTLKKEAKTKIKLYNNILMLYNMIIEAAYELMDELKSGESKKQ